MELRVNIQDVRSSGTDQRDLSWGGNEQKDQTIQQTKQIKEKDGFIAKGLFVNLGRSVISQATSRVGTYTGNYMLQNNLNNITSVLTAVGAVLTLNPLAISMVVLSNVSTALDYGVKLTQSNIEAEGLARLTGTANINRSRASGNRI
jgi:hypothetical protein